MSSKTEKLTELLVDLSKASQGTIQASLIISRGQGLPICSYYPDDYQQDDVPEEDTVSGRSMQIHEATNRVFSELKRGPFVRMLIEGESGYVIICGAGKDALLSVLTTKQVNLGFLFFMMSRIARRIAEVL